MARGLPKVPPSAARIGQLRKRVARNRQSNGGLGGGLASTAASMLIDFVSGFFNVNLSNDKKSKLGMFGRALGSGVSGGSVDSTPLPTMEQPTRVSNKTNPSLATITTQLEDLIKTANKIGLNTKEQQEAILKQINQTRRGTKEQQLENKTPAVPELPDVADSNNLAPLDSSVNGLIQKINELSETVTGLSRGGMGGLGGLPLDMLGGKGTSKAVAKTAGVGKGAAAAKSPSWLSRTATAVSEGTRSVASRVAAPIAVAAGAASSKVAGLMTAGFGSIKRTGGSIKETVRRVAGPIIGKALGKTALKSIPIVGAGIGAAFAVGRLLQGDVVGAGVELASGVAGPLTAVPALAASVTRDTYASVYGVQPEQDPNFGERYTALSGEVNQMIKEQLTGAVKPKSTPTEREIGEKETPAKPVQAAPAKQPPAIPSVAPPAVASGSPPGDASSSAAAPSSGAAASPSATTSSSGASKQQMTPSPTSGASLTSPTMEPSMSSMTGDTLTAQQMPVADINQSYGYDPSAGTFMPQTGSTSRGAAQGVGNIPSPVYSAPGLGGLKGTLFFDPIGPSIS